MATCTRLSLSKSQIVLYTTRSLERSPRVQDPAALQHPPSVSVTNLAADHVRVYSEDRTIKEMIENNALSPSGVLAVSGVNTALRGGLYET